MGYFRSSVSARGVRSTRPRTSWTINRKLPSPIVGSASMEEGSPRRNLGRVGSPSRHHAAARVATGRGIARRGSERIRECCPHSVQRRPRFTPLDLLSAPDCFERSRRCCCTLCEGSTRLPECGMLVGERCFWPLALPVFPRWPLDVVRSAMMCTPWATFAIVRRIMLRVRDARIAHEVQQQRKFRMRCSFRAPLSHCVCTLLVGWGTRR